MFDDQRPQSQSNNPPVPAKDKSIAPDSSIAAANTKTAPAVPSAPSREPEDIFDSVDSDKGHSGKSPFKPIEKKPVSQPASVPSPASSPTIKTDSKNKLDEALNAEPAIKTPPSVFQKITSIGNGTPPPTSPSASVPVPPIAPKSFSKANLFLLIVIFVVIIGVIAAAIWWFFGRSSTPPSVEKKTNSPVAELFNEVNQARKNQPQDKTKPAAKVTTPPPVPASPLDSDNDGLTDEEEAMIGTSSQSPDTDNDGLFDREEVKVYKTNPLLADTDNDGWSDKQEIELGQDPLVKNEAPKPDNYYRNDNFKIEFQYLPGMVLESATKNIILFNDDLNQIKLYIYTNNSQPADLKPDIKYFFAEDNNGNLIIKNTKSMPDETPYATDFSNNPYTSNNGLNYVIRYLATKRADNHEENFKAILSTVKFLP